MKTVVLSVQVRAPDSGRDEILATLKSLIGPASAEPSCRTCRVFQDHDNRNVITLVESWTSQEDLERHVKARQFKKLLAVIDMSEIEPEIRIDGISPQRSGLEVLEKLQPELIHPRPGDCPGRL